METLMEIGQIVNTYGIKGFVKVQPFTDNIRRFEDLRQIYLQLKKGLETFEIEEIKYHKQMVLLKLKGIDDINEAEKYRNCYLKIDRKDAVNLPEDTYFIADLLEMEVTTEEGEMLGKIKK